MPRVSAASAFARSAGLNSVWCWSAARSRTSIWADNFHYLLQAAADFGTGKLCFPAGARHLEER